MSRRAELTPAAWWLDAGELENRGLKRCEHCGQLFPLTVSRCRRRTCPGYAETWARDTMRKIRENLRAYEGLVRMCTLTAPGQEVGLIWDRSRCTHAEGVRCSGTHGCRVVESAARLWNEKSKAMWRAVKPVRKLGRGRRGEGGGPGHQGGAVVFAVGG